jgi:hypothetical protein
MSPKTVDRRRFPPPWTVEETKPCFIVRDANQQALAFVYFEDEPGRRATAKLLTRDEARRIAVQSCRSCLALSRGRMRMRSSKGDSLKGGNRRSLSGAAEKARVN